MSELNNAQIPIKNCLSIYYFNIFYFVEFYIKT